MMFLEMFHILIDPCNDNFQKYILNLSAIYSNLLSQIGIQNLNLSVAANSKLPVLLADRSISFILPLLFYSYIFSPDFHSHYHHVPLALSHSHALNV